MFSTDRRGIERARKLRKEMSYPEVLLWQALQLRPGGHKFRKQHGGGAQTLDFYCDKAQLCIEVDGIVHDMGDQPAYDVERDKRLALQGVETLRLPAKLVLNDRTAAIDAVVARCDERVAMLGSEYTLPSPP